MKHSTQVKFPTKFLLVNLIVLLLFLALVGFLIYNSERSSQQFEEEKDVIVEQLNKDNYNKVIDYINK